MPSNRPRPACREDQTHPGMSWHPLLREARQPPRRRWVHLYGCCRRPRSCRSILLLHPRWRRHRGRPGARRMASTPSMRSLPRATRARCGQALYRRSGQASRSGKVRRTGTWPPLSKWRIGARKLTFSERSAASVGGGGAALSLATQNRRSVANDRNRSHRMGYGR
jgi:hypothetical protein